MNAQIKALRKDMESEEFKNRYGTALEEYGKNSPVQQARTTVQEFSVALIELSEKALPAATSALSIFSGALGFIDKYNKPAPEGQQSGWGIIPRAYKYMFPPKKEGDDPAAAKKMNFLQGPPENKQMRFEHTTDLKIDGRSFAMAVSEVIEELYEHPTGSPSPDGLGKFRPQGNFSST